ncbi:MAG: exodeoxyribonuclease III [Myxococcota bacterium]|nr:exodeoxyribonuclease III [Myxococcota bacterium]
MKLISWNVNGIRAAAKKGFLEFLDTCGADLVFVQETKAQPDQLDDSLKHPPGWDSAFAVCERKGYSGTAVYWNTETVGEPDEVQCGLGIERFDVEGRVIMARYGDLCVYGNYFPNGGKGVERVDYKLDFYDHMLRRMNALRREGRDVVVCGDYNTAHHEVDLARPKANSNTSGFLMEERAWLDRWVDDGWVDSFREIHPEARDVYSWWSFRSGSRERNVGWRIDYFLVDEAARGRIRAADIDMDQMGSDHAPVSLELEPR